MDAESPVPCMSGMLVLLSYEFWNAFIVDPPQVTLPVPFWQGVSGHKQTEGRAGRVEQQSCLYPIGLALWEFQAFQAMVVAYPLVWPILFSFHRILQDNNIFIYNTVATLSRHEGCVYKYKMK